jgi:ATP-dependent Lon protease
MNFFNKKDDRKVMASGAETVLGDLRLKQRKVDLPGEVAGQVESELVRLEKMDPFAAEFSIGVGYVETLLDMPWAKKTKDNLDLKRAAAILNQHHYGLQTVKTRVLEYLAVKTLRAKEGHRILIVDDEEVARENLSHFFSALGYGTQVAENGMKALEVMESEPDFDLVITDLKMAGMDGLALVDQIRKLAPDLNVVMLTGYATVSSAVEALGRGVVRYLAKPVKLDELRGVVESILEGDTKLRLTGAPILCFSGPPGTGKTSICKAVAAALGRRFTGLSMGGLRDESEIYGHRRTYAGAMPGRIVSEIKRIGVVNPCFMLDEIDKVGQDFRGDPAAVLLDVLDPEQNSRFKDHYLEVPFDLSEVMFMATANDISRLPAPLLDRLEVIDFPSYTLQEKKIIARKYLLPSQLKESGLAEQPPALDDGALDLLISGYTRESGVRSLNREIGRICRALALESLTTAKVDGLSADIDEAELARLLGPRKFHREAAGGRSEVGVVTGLVWTSFGGEIMFVEALIMRGAANLILTGSLGEVLRESAQTALSYIRSNASVLGLDDDFYLKNDIHIHLPAGAVSKDGPSAGVTIAIALVSLLSKRPVHRDIAITGEMTLTGHLLAVGGIREKVLAAIRTGCSTVVLPTQNREDVAALPSEVADQIELVLVDHLTEALPLFLCDDASA